VNSTDLYIESYRSQGIDYRYSIRCSYLSLALAPSLVSTRIQSQPTLQLYEAFGLYSAYCARAVECDRQSCAILDSRRSEQATLFWGAPRIVVHSARLFGRGIQHDGPASAHRHHGCRWNSPRIARHRRGASGNHSDGGRSITIAKHDYVLEKCL
jgi:hypothetical protein